MKTELEVAEILSAFDALYEPYRHVARGVSVWRLIRASVGSQLKGLPIANPTLARSKLFSASIRSIFRYIIDPKLNAEFAVMSYTSALRIKGIFGFEDIYFEELLRNRPNGIRLHSVNTIQSKTRQHGLQTKSCDCTAIYILGGLLARLLPAKDDLDVFEELSALIHQHLGANGFDASYILRAFSSFWWQSQIFRFLLVHSEIKTIIVADNAERALIHACRNLNIRFIELQHGVFNPSDPDCVPAVALKQGDDASLLLPHVFAQLGDYWSDRHAKTAIGELGTTFAVGSSTIARYFEFRKSLFQSNPDFPKLVVTTQGLDASGLVSFIAAFLNIYTAPCSLKIKLHPAYDRSAQPYAKALAADPRVEIILGDTEPNTYELIAHADLHLSIASACHFDALGIGTPTAVLNLQGSDVVQDLVKNGDALYITAPADLADIVTLRAWGEVSTAVSNKYFKQDYLNNILRLMQ